MRSLFLKSSPSHSPPNHNHNHHPTFSQSLMEENIEIAHSFISKWDTADSTTFLFSHDHHNEAVQYLSAVSDLHSAMHFFTSDHSSPDNNNLVRAQSLMQLAMKRLEKEFYHILSSSRSSLSDADSDLDDASSAAMSDLKSIADCMIASGYGRECVKIYKVIRKSIVDETLYRLGVERLTFSQVHKMEWGVLEPKIKTWLNAVKIAVRTLFYGERYLCDYVFSASDSSRESCFSDVAKEGALSLFGFPESVAKCKKSPEKMFRTLDLYEAISLYWPDIETIFSFESTAVVRMLATGAVVKLADAVRSMLADFEAMVQKDTSKKALPGGGVHPATRYIANYIQFLGDYSDSLADIIADWPMPQAAPIPESYLDSAISIRFAWLVLVLLCKVDSRAELYNKDVALSYLFLANNLNYVILKVRSSNLKHLLGEEWIAAHEAKVRQYAASYERMGWNRVLSAIPTAEVSLEEARERFGRFNSAFDEAYRKQVSWVVTDPKLRDEIKYALAERLVPAYRVFYQKYRVPLAREMGEGSCVRYAPEDLDNYLSDLFFGSGSGSSSSMSTTSYQSPTH